MLSLLSLLLLPCALAAPSPDNAVHIPILGRSISPEQRIAKLPQIMDAIRVKYGYQTNLQKRSTTSAPITDEGNDASYSAVVGIGTPAQQFNLILDTGSSDLWVADDQCTTCGSVPVFTSSKSSSFKGSSSSVVLSYGSGQVRGTVSQDSVTFSGFTQNQQLLSVSKTSTGLLTDPLSGIMGLGFNALSTLNVTPFWQTLLNGNQLTSPVFSFYLARYINQNQISQAPGGTFTLGGTNTSLYTGNIEFIKMPSGTTPSFWLQQLQTITVQGTSISIPSSEGLAAIDTGTTLIGAPSDLVREIYSNIPGSVALSGQFQGMYAYPCSTSVSVSLNFGGTSWPISAADMNLGAVSGSGSRQMCGGGIFDVGNTVGSGPGVPSWIVGDTFLKNVYSVYQANPPAVGFAQLASGLSNNTASGSNPIGISAGVPLPTGTPIGPISASSRMIASTSLSLAVAVLSAVLVTM